MAGMLTTRVQTKCSHRVGPDPLPTADNRKDRRGRIRERPGTAPFRGGCGLGGRPPHRLDPLPDPSPLAHLLEESPRLPASAPRHLDAPPPVPGRAHPMAPVPPASCPGA